ncbi:MAG: antibiotic biosynthesis monooxygenase [Oleiphilus sp.]|nr:MAG: antibiotic biosynthesis monooxygenase [Oleiphilus sp.]
MYVVIFRAKVKHQGQDYQETAERMRELAMQNYRCLDFISMSEGDEELSLSYWPDAEAIQRWRQDPEHKKAQAMGEKYWYESYQIEVSEVKRHYRSKGTGHE